jgi:hypothetical protein
VLDRDAPWYGGLAIGTAGALALVKGFLGII